ncbi:hypothetical protein Lalb_Chr20g0116671 [Lupinus albus]|uniref:Uncharacterized protein n=1 Tax=Lupinus albus TaxID=3870 RepID=A0A6A4NKC6_LUPAL|nr:hypothetical protein Lalb_Chr20g0116671 [Lupinus albus]
MKCGSENFHGDEVCSFGSKRNMMNLLISLEIMFHSWIWIHNKDDNYSFNNAYKVIAQEERSDDFVIFGES